MFQNSYEDSIDNWASKYSFEITDVSKSYKKEFTDTGGNKFEFQLELYNPQVFLH